MENDIGGGLDDLLFESNSALIVFNAKRRIEETINNHEKRIELIDVNVFRTEDLHGIVFEIQFMFANRPDIVTETIRVDRRR
jgi:phage baseplate assembly protein W